MKLSYFMAAGALYSLLNGMGASAIELACPTGDTPDTKHFMCLSQHPKPGYHLSKNRNAGQYQRCAPGYYFAGGACVAGGSPSELCGFGDTHNPAKHWCERSAALGAAVGYYTKTGVSGKLLRCDNQSSYDKASDSCININK